MAIELVFQMCGVLDLQQLRDLVSMTNPAGRGDVESCDHEQIKEELESQENRHFLRQHWPNLRLSFQLNSKFRVVADSYVLPLGCKLRATAWQEI